MSKDRYAISSLNPHTHAGCDFLHGGNLASRRSFNPHTHAGCDNRYKCNYTRRRVSIHTPTQGVTLSSHRVDDHYQFQSTHPRRVWHSLNAKWEKGGSFNPHTHAGCDQKKWTVLTIKNSFNPHTHAGCDIVWYSLLTRQKSFNPHTHAGCDQRCKPNTTHGKFQSTHPRRVWPR